MCQLLKNGFRSQGLKRETLAETSVFKQKRRDSV